MKIALSMISEGDHKHLKRAVKSVYKYVDHIFITTTKINKPQWDDPKITWSFFPWCDDFAKARNFNLQQVPPEFKYILWIDSDDVVINPDVIPEVVYKMEESNLDAIYTDYNYEISKNGDPLIVHPRERIVKRSVYYWKAPLHETLIKTRKVNTLYIKDFYVNHYPDSKDRDIGFNRNYRILSKDYEEQRKRLIKGEIQEIDPRTEFYLGRVLYDTKTDTGYKRAFKLFQDYVEHSGWDEERAFAWNYLGNIQYHFQQYEDSINCYLMAIEQRPEFPTWHINLARSYAALKDFSKAEHHLNVGINMDQPNTAMILTPIEDKRNALLVSFFIGFNKKDFKQAIEAAEMLCDIEYSKENIGRVESVKKLQKWTDWMKSTTQMVEELSEQRKYDQINNLINSLPKEVKNTVYADILRAQHGKPRVWPNKSIVYYAAIDTLEWSPLNLKTGLGGSEESIVYLAEYWTKKGYKVTVYTNVGANEGNYGGVEYLNYQRFNFKDKFDILVSWRNPYFIDKNLLDARLVLLDLHDVPDPKEYDQSIIDKVDYFMVKSDYHRSLLPNIPDDKFKIVGNGIDWEYLKTFKEEKVKNSCFYGSSYDRGLENVLKIWPDVLKEIPDATLHICYGWDLFDKIRGHVASFRKWKQEIVKLMDQPGIIHHGKVGKEELYTIASQCEYWTYPTNFEEIDCITARYCQAVGTMPVIYDYAALKTTVQRGERLAVDPSDKSLLEKYKTLLIETMKQGKKIDDVEEIGNQMSWDKVSDKWIEIFNEPIKQDTLITVFTPTIRSGFWNIMADNLSKQTYKNIEWLIVDDYPEDRADVAKKYAEKYNLNIRYIRGKKKTSKYNYSLIQADNQAIYSAKGKLIVWLQDFILLPYDGIERLVKLNKNHPNSLLAPVDRYYQMSVKPDLNSKEDWFNGETNVIGKFIRQNTRINKEEIRYSNNPYEFEMNIGAIPTHIARKLNGLWEFQDDGLGFNNTEIAFRALKVGFSLIVDERLKGICLDLWEHLRGSEENAINREWNLNDPRYEFIYQMTNNHRLPIIRNSSLDRNIKLTYEMPKGLDPEQAAQWIQKNTTKITNQWMKETPCTL